MRQAHRVRSVSRAGPNGPERLGSRHRGAGSVPDLIASGRQLSIPVIARFPPTGVQPVAGRSGRPLPESERDLAIPHRTSLPIRDRSEGSLWTTGPTSPRPSDTRSGRRTGTALVRDRRRWLDPLVCGRDAALAPRPQPHVRDRRKTGSRALPRSSAFDTSNGCIQARQTYAIRKRRLRSPPDPVDDAHDPCYPADSRMDRPAPPSACERCPARRHLSACCGSPRWRQL